jgi:branched-chain amino acid transport system ATP-binding protein
MSTCECLRVSELTVKYGGLLAVDKFCMTVEQGEIVSLIGPNGAGKTTVLNLLTGFARPSGGRIEFQGNDITGSSPARIAANGIRRTFQQNSLMFDLTVGENVRAGLHTRVDTGLFASLFYSATFRDEDRAIRIEVDRVLDAVGMRAQRDIVARNLPFGDQRKLGIGIAIAARPRLLLLDEPAAGLNPDESAQLTALIRRLREDGITIVLVEHDMRVVMGVSDRIVVLCRGEKLAEGNGQEISTNKEVLRAYLGDGSWAMPANINSENSRRGR